MRAPTRFDAEDPFGRKASAPREDQSIFLGVDVVSDDGQIDSRMECASQALDERGLPGSDGTTDSDAKRVHDTNILPGSNACRIASISHSKACVRRSFVEVILSARCAAFSMRLRSCHSVSSPARCPIGIARTATETKALTVVER